MFLKRGTKEDPRNTKIGNINVGTLYNSIKDTCFYPSPSPRKKGERGIPIGNNVVVNNFTQKGN